MTDKPMTVGDVRNAIKDLPDDMPVFLDDEHECMEAISIQEKALDVYHHDSEETTEINALVLGVT